MAKVILISGGSDGLGYAIAKRLLPRNKVTICSPTKEKLEKAAKELNCDFEVCDVSDKGDVKTMVNNIVEKHGKIDCLVNNAGLWIQGELDSNDPDNIKRVLEVNTLGVVLLSREVIPHMKKEKNGLIINVVSQAGIYGKAERGVYTTSKFAIAGLTKSLADELAKYGIKVTGLYPGKLRTQMFQKMGIKKEMDNGLELEEVARTVEFILSADKDTLFPEVGIKHINN